MEFFCKELRIISDISLASRAYEKVKTERTSLLDWKRFVSKHNYDTLISAFLFLLLIVGAAYWALKVAVGPGATASEAATAASLQVVQILLGASVFGAGINIITKFVDVSQKRLGTVDSFISEILSIGRVFTSGNIIGGLIHCYDQVERIVVQYQPNPPPLRNFSIRYDESLRKENYTSNFDRNCPDLGPFSAEVVSNVTAFYTFLRASRDATGALSLWNKEHYPIDLRKNDIIIITYYCLLMAIHGRKSLESLIERTEQLEYARSIFCTIELQAFLFLVFVLPDSDPRSIPTQERKEDYKRLIRENGLQNADQLIKMIDEQPALEDSSARS